MVKDVWAGDLALIELARGSTDAPPEVLSELFRRGHVLTAGGGSPSLTAAGRARAEKLRDAEQDLRRMHIRGEGRCGITTAGGSSLRF